MTPFASSSPTSSRTPVETTTPKRGVTPATPDHPSRSFPVTKGLEHFDALSAQVVRLFFVHPSRDGLCPRRGARAAAGAPAPACDKRTRAGASAATDALGDSHPTPSLP